MFEDDRFSLGVVNDVMVRVVLLETLHAWVGKSLTEKFLNVAVSSLGVPYCL